MREPPKPGEQIVLLYRWGESKYGLTAACGIAIFPCDLGLEDALGIRVNDHTVLYRRLNEEGIWWARWSGSAAEFGRLGGWCDVVPVLLAARALAGTGE